MRMITVTRGGDCGMRINEGNRDHPGCLCNGQGRGEEHLDLGFQATFAVLIASNAVGCHKVGPSGLQPCLLERTHADIASTKEEPDTISIAAGQLSSRRAVRAARPCRAISTSLGEGEC